MSIEATEIKMKLDNAIASFEAATSALTDEQAVLAEATKAALKTFETEIIRIAKLVK